MVTADTRSNNEEITTRDGFHEWWRNAARQCDYGRVLLPTHHEAYKAGKKSAKTEELAFLGELVQSDNNSIAWNKIENRIAKLRNQT